MTPGAAGFLAARIVFGAASLFMTLAMSIAVLGGLVTHPRTFFSPVTESVIWDLFRPANRRRKRRRAEGRRQKGTQRHSETPARRPGWLRLRVDFIQEHKTQVLENPTVSPRLQQAWQFVTGRGPEGAEETPEAFSIRQQWYGSITLFGTILSIVAIELTISWNHITNVYSMSSTGQLIAFVVGLGPLIMTVHGVLKEKALTADSLYLEPVN
ncbi:hypothetical protein ACEPPN_007473 [Leptodophora sp. 'Broadleaf-Isolate-01']